MFRPRLGSTLPSVSTVADAILVCIRKDGFHVGEIGYVDARDGSMSFVCTARNSAIDETWTVRAADRGQAACELAKALGWNLEDG